jgi:GAF domain-containing protein
MADDRLWAAVAAGVLPAEDRFAALLRSIVDVARAFFDARASSIFLFDEDASELVFAAVSGEGESTLVGARIPAGTGIAGWVLASRTPLALDDVQNDPRFARDVAERTGFVPNALMAAPLLDGERVLGVLQVLDRPQGTKFTLREMELLGLFANQAAIALDLLSSARQAREVLAEQAEELGVVAQLAATVDALEGSRRDDALRLLAELERLLR